MADKKGPSGFIVMLADGIMVIPQDSPLSWITLFYALPRELVEKRPAYLTLPRNIVKLLSDENGRQRKRARQALVQGTERHRLHGRESGSRS